MTVRVITAPAEEPVSVATAKLHLRVDNSADDVLIGTLITAARVKGEAAARRAFITQTLEATFDDWPSSCHMGGLLPLPRPPLQSVTSVKYFDENGVEHTWTDFQVDTRSEPGRLYFVSLPTETLFFSGAINIRYVAGWGNAAACPEPIKQGILASVAYWYEMRDATGPLPGLALGMFQSYRANWF